MSEERTPDQIAWALLQELSPMSEPTTKGFDRDLQEALYTLSEGLDIHLEPDMAIQIWQLVEYLSKTKLRDEFKL